MTGPAHQYEVFDDEALAESRTLNEQIGAALDGAPTIVDVGAEETRASRLEGRGAFPAPVYSDRAENRTVRSPDGHDVDVRVVVPEDPRGVYLHLHGGGWAIGRADQQDPLLTGLADRLGVAVVSVEYRLAPEHPFPAGPDDCEAAACWLLDRAAAEFGTEVLAIGGESAGAHLSALTLLRLRDRHDAASRFSGANLVYGCFDFAGTPSARRWGARNLILNTPIIDWFVEHATPGLTSEERRDPSISPLYADLHGLPPARFSVGTLDPLLDDTLFMAARWQAAGNDTEVSIYPESIHGFTAFPTAIGTAARSADRDFLQRTMFGT